MKPKLLTYILIAAVTAVWGIVFYRIFAVDNGSQPVIYQPSVLKKEPVENYESADTAVLALDYRDPFLGSMPPAEDTAVDISVSNEPAVPEARPISPAVNWEVIKYTGCIKNPQNKKLVPIMNINNKEKMMTAGETWEGVKILAVFKDSVKVSWQGKIKYIHLQ